MKKALIVVTIGGFITSFEMRKIDILQSMGYEVYCAGNFSLPEGRLEKQQLIDKKTKVFEIEFQRNPLDIKYNGRAYKQLKKIFKEHRFDIVHCHTPTAGVITRLVANQYRKKGTKVIYTAHGFHFYKGAPLLNWLLFYPVEKLLSYLTDVLILINKEDYNRAKTKFHAKRTEYVPGVGIDIKKYSCELIDRKKKRQSLGVNNKDIMLLSVGELIPRKNHEIVIDAIAQVKDEKYKYFICGKGELYTNYQSKISKLGLENQVFLLGHRNDISELCQAADLYVFPSRQEGLSVALMEAIACHVPVICSDIRGNNDLIRNQRCLFPPEDMERLLQCLRNATKGGISEEIRSTTEDNYKILEKCDMKYVTEQMSEIYSY